MGLRGGFTRRGLFGAGASGAAVLAASACGDDYFEPATDHAKDAPNVLLLFTDSTRADYISHYNPDSLAKTPNIDALARDSLTFSHAVPEAMPTGPARRALLTGVRSFPFRNYVPNQGTARRAGLDPDPGLPPDRDRGARRGRRRDRLLHRQPLPDRPPLRQLPPHRRLDQAELLPGRLPLPQQALQAARHALHDRALPASRALRQRGGRPPARDGGLELDLPRLGRRLPDRPRDPRRPAPARRPQGGGQALLPRHRRVRPARAARRAADLPGALQLRAEGHREAGNHADPAVRDPLLVGDRRGRRRRDDRARAASCTPPRSSSWTSGSGAS